MSAAHRLRFLAAAEQVYFAPDEVCWSRASGPVTHLLRHPAGRCRGEQRLGARGPFALEAGELFPVSAVLGARGRSPPPTRRAATPSACACPPLVVRDAGRRQPALRRLRQPPHAAAAGAVAACAAERFAVSRVLAEQSLEAPLADFARGTPLAVPPQTPLARRCRRCTTARRLGAGHRRPKAARWAS
jgi:hypothetical protein